jgi:hypothetical protein
MKIDEMTVGELKQIAGIAKGLRGTRKASTIEQKRVVLVVDRGWIFAGDQSLTSDGYIRLTNAVHVFRWESIGFAQAIEDWKSDKVDIRKCSDVEVPKDSVVFRIPVEAGWGIK